MSPFMYLLNAFEEASQADEPAKWGYGERRRKLIEYVTKLERAWAVKLAPMTPKEIYEQKISWIRGMSGKLSDPMPSREDVVKALAEMGVVDPEPVTNGDVE